MGRALRPASIRGLRLSYQDYGGPGQPMLALHGHFGRAASFAGVAEALAPGVRLIALEQRAHGESEDDGDRSRTAYVEDAAAFLRWLDLGPLPVLGHSMGGVTAYQRAARHPELVSALVIEEAGAVVGEPILDVTDWPHRTGMIDELRTAIEARDMAWWRPATTLVEFDQCGHFVHDEDLAGFADAVRDFLRTLPGAAG